MTAASGAVDDALDVWLAYLVEQIDAAPPTDGPLRIHNHCRSRLDHRAYLTLCRLPLRAGTPASSCSSSSFPSVQSLSFRSRSSSVPDCPSDPPLALNCLAGWCTDTKCTRRGCLVSVHQPARRHYENCWSEEQTGTDTCVRTCLRTPYSGLWVATNMTGSAQ